MSKMLAGNATRLSGTRFLLALCCPSPTFLAHFLPDLPDERHLSQTSFQGGRLAAGETFPLCPPLWPCLPSKGLLTTTARAFPAPGVRPGPEPPLLPSPLLHTVPIKVEFPFCFLIWCPPVNATAGGNSGEQVLSVWMFRFQ